MQLRYLLYASLLPGFLLSQPAMSTCAGDGQSCASLTCCDSSVACTLYGSNHLCCNELNGWCSANDDCCSPGNLCLASSSKCKIAAGYGWCSGAADCMPGPSGQTVGCVSGTCCNDVNAWCSSDSDCCAGGNECQTSSSECKITAGHGWCDQASDCATDACASGNCEFSTPGNPCIHNSDCLIFDGGPSNGDKSFTMDCNDNAGHLICCNYVNQGCLTNAQCCTPSNECNTSLNLCKITGGNCGCDQNTDCGGDLCMGGCCPYSGTGGTCLETADCETGLTCKANHTCG